MKKYLKTFLAELPNQTFFDSLEVILDHNAPSEDELVWVKQFQADYPDHIRHMVIPHVDPIGISMNRCIRESSGDLLCIWNVDDLRTPESIEAQVNALKDNQSVDIIYGNYEVTNSFPSKKGKLVDHSQIPESELTRSMILGPFFMFRKSLLFKSGKFDEQFKSGCDFDLAIRLAFHGKAKRIDENLGYYLNEGLGASTRKESLQPVELTAIELRYGIYEKIDYSHLQKALNYRIYELLNGNAWISIANLIPRYSEMLEENKNTYLEKGMNKFLRDMRMKKVCEFISKFKQRL